MAIERPRHQHFKEEGAPTVLHISHRSSSLKTKFLSKKTPICNDSRPLPSKKSLAKTLLLTVIYLATLSYSLLFDIHSSSMQQGKKGVRHM